MYMGCDEEEGFEAQLVPGRSRPKIDADLELILRCYRMPGEWRPGQEKGLGVTLEQLATWNDHAGIRQRARDYGVLSAEQDVVLYRALAAFASQTIPVREATLRVVRTLEGCYRRTGFRGIATTPMRTSSMIRGAAVGWGRFGD